MRFYVSIALMTTVVFLGACKHNPSSKGAQSPAASQIKTTDRQIKTGTPGQGVKEADKLNALIKREEQESRCEPIAPGLPVPKNAAQCAQWNREWQRDSSLNFKLTKPIKKMH